MNSFLGSIQLVGFDFAPANWAFCNGQILSISENQALYSLLGPNYGGDGVSNFALPNLNAGTLQSGLNYIICVADGVYPQRGL